jgi:hypothetical protein
MQIILRFLVDFYHCRQDRETCSFAGFGLNSNSFLTPGGDDENEDVA